ncbi:Uncharacterised protein [Acinetobacter baumannii]|nr:Uncharacterised protein [Acinetobacter baumannii]
MVSPHSLPNPIDSQIWRDLTKRMPVSSHSRYVHRAWKTRGHAARRLATPEVPTLPGRNDSRPLGCRTPRPASGCRPACPVQHEIGVRMMHRGCDKRPCICHKNSPFRPRHPSLKHLGENPLDADQLSSRKVTGPSLTRCTCMSAPKRPVATCG